MRILLLIIAALGLNSCIHQPNPPRATAGTEVAVTVDPRIELMSVVQLLGGYFLVTQHPIAYKEEARRYFAPHASHRAVVMFKEMSKKGFAFNNVPEAMVRFGAPPDLSKRAGFSPGILEAAGGEARLEEFSAALRDFAQVSNFARFFADHGAFYRTLAERTRPSVLPVMGELEAYTGLPLRNATVVLGPMLHDGGFAGLLELPGGRSEAYAFIGPMGASEGVPEFGSAARIGSLAAHEFAHLIVNPLTDRQAALVNRHAGNFPALKESMHKNGYEDWNTVVSEHVIRAITTRLVYRGPGEEAGRKALEEELKRGFVYLPALISRLEAYEQQRGRYRKIADFYPTLLEAFEKPI